MWLEKSSYKVESRVFQALQKGGPCYPRVTNDKIVSPYIVLSESKRIFAVVCKNVQEYSLEKSNCMKDPEVIRGFANNVVDDFAISCPNLFYQRDREFAFFC